MFLLSACAVLHKTQIGEIDNRSNHALVPFEIKVSETGVDMRQVTAIQRSLFKDNRAANALGSAAAIISLFQMGPRTGYPVFTENYAKDLIYAIHTQCPSGMITGLMTVREMRKYPIVSGEIVKVRGYCLRNKEKT
jgi:hypothetical protein